MRQAEKEIKEFQTRIPLMPDAREKIPKKNCKKIQKIKKQLFDVSFRQNGIIQDEIGQERDKRMLNPNSAHTRPEGENSEKKFKKKITKLKKQLSGVIFSQNGMRQAEKEIKEFQTRIPLILDPGEQITKKKTAKKFEKLENNYSALFLAKLG